MVLAFVKLLIEYGHNPTERLWVQCVDVDRTAALMCFIQLSLWNVPAEIIVGNTLTLETREVWRTRQHFLGIWDHRLKASRATGAPETPQESVLVKKASSSPEDQKGPSAASPEPSLAKTKETRSGQFDFGF